MIHNPYKIKNKLIKIQIPQNHSLNPNIYNLQNNNINTNHPLNTNSLISNSNCFFNDYISQPNSLITQININNINKSNSKYYYGNRNNSLPHNYNSYRDLLNIYQNNSNIVVNKLDNNQKNINVTNSNYKLIEQKQKYANRSTLYNNSNEKEIHISLKRNNSQLSKLDKPENNVKNLKNEKIPIQNDNFLKIAGNFSRENEMKITNNSFLGNFPMLLKNENNNIFDVSPNCYNLNEIKNENIFNNNSNFAVYKNMSNNLLLRNTTTTTTNTMYQNYYNRDLLNNSDNNPFVTPNNNVNINIPNNNSNNYQQNKIQNFEKKIFKNVFEKLFIIINKYCKNYQRQHFKYFLSLLKKYNKSNLNNKVYTKNIFINSMNYNAHNESPKKMITINTNSNKTAKYTKMDDNKKLINQIRINKIKQLNIGNKRKNFKNSNLKNNSIGNENSKFLFNTINENYPKSSNNNKKQNINNSMNSENVYSKKIINQSQKSISQYLNEKNCFSERGAKNNLIIDESTKKNLKFKLSENYTSKDGKINIIQKIISACPFFIYSAKHLKTIEVNNFKNINIKKYTNLKPIHETIFYIKQNKLVQKNSKIVVNNRKNYSVEKRTIYRNNDALIDTQKNNNKNRNLYKFDIQIKSNCLMDLNKIQAFTGHLINVIYMKKYKIFFNKLKLIKKKNKNKKRKSGSTKNIANYEINRAILQNSKNTFLKNYINCDKAEKKNKIKKVVDYFKDK